MNTEFQPPKQVPVKSYTGLQAAPLPDAFNSYEKWPEWCPPSPLCLI
jgi:hypothetical protein